MNPNKEQAPEDRRQLLLDQIEGLERWIADGRDDPHLLKRLEHTRAELAEVEESRDQ